MHLDLDCDDLDAEIARLLELGAWLLARHETWVTLGDPDGNEFDLMQAEPGFSLHVTSR